MRVEREGRSCDGYGWWRRIVIYRVEVLGGEMGNLGAMEGWFWEIQRLVERDGWIFLWTMVAVVESIVCCFVHEGWGTAETLELVSDNVGV